MGRPGVGGQVRGPVTSQRRSGIIRNNLYVSRSISEVSGSRGPLLDTFLRYLIPNIGLEPTTRFAHHQDNLTFRISDLITCLCFLNVWLNKIKSSSWPRSNLTSRPPLSTTDKRETTLQLSVSPSYCVPLSSSTYNTNKTQYFRLRLYDSDFSALSAL